MTELTLEHDGLLQIRQMAALLLKQYVDRHWSSLSEKFQGPETSTQAKATIRSMLPHGLKESISKVSCWKKMMQKCINNNLATLQHEYNVKAAALYRRKTKKLQKSHLSPHHLCKGRNSLAALFHNIAIFFAFVSRILN